MTHLYARPEYAASLSHIGAPFAVPEWGCHVLARPIEGGGVDAVGCYPLAVLAADADLAAGLARLREAGFVSVVLTLDEAHRPPLAALAATFDEVAPYKTHYLAHPAIDRTLPRYHKRKIRAAVGAVEARPFALAERLDEWCALYANLEARHAFQPIHRFPHDHFELLASAADVTAIGAFASNELLSAHIWVEHHGQVFSHLTASSEQGYAVSAAYAVNLASIAHFTGAKALNFGGGAGIGDEPCGLARFKSGFADAAASSWLAKSVLDPAAYAALTRDLPATAYFPGYRQPTAAAISTNG